jgi:hypothetical protein
MNQDVQADQDTASTWWSARRFRYNLILICAAPLSLLVLLFVWWAFEARLPCLEITGFSLIAGAILFAMGLVLANLFYFLGPLVELLIPARRISTYRSISFALGTGFSLLLIFFPVIGNLLAAVAGPQEAIACKNI